MKKLLGMLLMVFPTIVLAVNVPSLYQVELPVASQGSEERGEAVKQAFTQVLARISGDPEIGKNPVIKTALRKPDYFVEEFSYSTSPVQQVATDEEGSADNELTSSQYYIHLRFNKADIARLLQKAGVAHWGDTRPLIMVWLSVGGPNLDTQIIGTDSPSGLLGLLRQEANKRGLPIILPMMDVADMSMVSESDIAQMSLPALKEAGKRYHPEAYLIGKIQQTPQEVKSEWQLVWNDQHWGWSFTDKSLDQVVASLLNEVSQTLAQHYVKKSTQAAVQWVKLEVMNIKEGDDLAHLMQYLKQLKSIQQVQLSQVSGDTVELSVQMQESLDAFQQNAFLDKRLIFKPNESLNNKLVYEWAH